LVDIKRGGDGKKKEKVLYTIKALKNKTGKKGGMMKKRLLGFLLIASMCFITCGNEPPEEFYEGTPEDDAAIDAILENDYPEFLVTTDGFFDTYVPVNIGPIEITDQDGLFRADSPLIKQHIDSCRLAVDTMYRNYDRWYSKDTACTVYLIDTFDVESWAHVDLRIIGHYDSIGVDTIYGDTNYFLGTIDTVIPTGNDAYSVEDIEGDGRRLIFFEPRRSTTEYVVDEETGDTTYVIIEPFDWQLKRISYGTYYYPTRSTDAPTIDRVLFDRGTSVDTVLSSSYDTLYMGHVMNRFRHIDSLLEFTAGDSVLVSIEFDDAVASQEGVYYALCAGDTSMNRVQLPTIATGGRGILIMNGQGIVNLYFEIVYQDSYYYVNPNQGYLATVWLIPVRVN
jgi:hypothetical protein